MRVRDGREHGEQFFLASQRRLLVLELSVGFHLSDRTYIWRAWLSTTELDRHGWRADQAAIPGAVRDSAATRRRILEAATAEFAGAGLAGGRIARIAQRARA